MLQSTVWIPASARTASNAAVKFEPRSRIHELDLICLFAEVHEEVAGLLGGPLPGGMQGDPEDADPAGGVLDHGQDIGLGAIEQAGREEVAHQDGLSLRAQEL
jgi:hypothetical protein